MLPDLPTGTVTFLFTDIEGSTRLLRETGERWPGLLARHQDLLRSAVAGEGGIEVSTEGDSFFCVFPTAPAAVAAAVAAQRALYAEAWPEDGQLRVRMGLHSGEGRLSGGTYVGIDVHRAARIAAAGHGGQVLISQAAHALTAASLPDGVELRELGAHRLKDLDDPEPLWQLVIPGLPADFPPLRTLDTPNNLPEPLTTFLGRENEIREVTELLGGGRLLTLTGPGGTGKTRLSLEVARRATDQYPDGVWWIELGAITEPELVPSTIAQQLGLPDRGGRSALERLTDYLGPKRVLLVLDNFEQVEAAGPSISELLAAAPTASVLVTSRSVLHLYGEQEYPVPPLNLPDPQHLPDLAALSQYEAVALFIARAQAVKPGFRVTNENAPAVAEICVRLDGLPLAIELAAARIRILTPEAMLGRLERRLGLLAGGSRDLPARQQTLRGAIAWSWDMLDEGDRALFTDLSVFVGGAGLDEIERVAGADAGGDVGDVLEGLTSLVDKSLLRQRDGGGEPRFKMLETIREFAMEAAAEAGRWEELRSRHGALFVELTEEAGHHLMTSDKRSWLDHLEEDHDNIRAALTWAVETGQVDRALRLASAMWRFWQMRGYLVEGYERVKEALALPDAAPHPEPRARALNAAAGLAYWLGRNEEARAWYDQEIDLRRAIGDRAGLAEALYSQSFTLSVTGLLDQKMADDATAFILEALAIFRELGDRGGIARCLWAMANVDWGAGRTEEAVRLAREAHQIFVELDDQFMAGWSCYTLALSIIREAFEGKPVDLLEARRWLTESLRIFSEAGDVSGYTLVLDALAYLESLEGDRERAARISGAVSALERITGTGLNTPNRQVLGWDPSTLQADPTLAEAWAQGEQMSAVDAVSYALEGAPVAAT